MHKKALLISVLAIVIIISAFSGCFGSTTTTTPTTAPTTGGTNTGTTTGTGKIAVTTTGNTITISGDKMEKTASDAFKLDKDSWYLITYTYTGPSMSNFIAEIATPDAIAADEAVGGLLPMLLEPGKGTVIKEKGVYKSTDYKLYADKIDGPWTVTIEKSPTPTASGQTSFSHKVSDSYNSVTPYFHLNKGSATFTVNQQLTQKFASAADVELYNADTGDYVASVTHNDNDASITDTEDIPADGNYILGVSCGGDWQISFTQ